MRTGSTTSAGRRVLHVLSQRPSLTGSGITLDALVRLAGKAGWEQEAAVGVPAGGPPAEVGGLTPGFSPGRLSIHRVGLSPGAQCHHVVLDNSFKRKTRTAGLKGAR